MRLLLGLFFDFEPRSALPLLLRRFLFHLYYHYLAIPNKELVRGQCLSCTELRKINKKKCHAEFHENPTNDLVTYTKLRMDGRVDVVVHGRLPFFAS